MQVFHGLFIKVFGLLTRECGESQLTGLSVHPRHVFQAFTHLCRSLCQRRPIYPRKNVLDKFWVELKLFSCEFGVFEMERESCRFRFARLNGACEVVCRENLHGGGRKLSGEEEDKERLVKVNVIAIAVRTLAGQKRG